MEINAATLQCITYRGDELPNESELDKILRTCLKWAIQGFEFETFPLVDGENFEATREWLVVSWA